MRPAISSSSTGGRKKKPCTDSQPSLRTASSCAAVSTPLSHDPQPQAVPESDHRGGHRSSPVSVPRPCTKDLSTLSTSTGNRVR